MDTPSGPPSSAGAGAGPQHTAASQPEAASAAAAAEAQAERTARRAAMDAPPEPEVARMPLIGGSVGLIGLGNIGMCVCKRLLCAGFNVKACEIRKPTIEVLTRMGAKVCDSPSEAAKDVALVVICVFTAAQVEDVLFGNADSGEAGLITTLPLNGTICLHTTVSPDEASKFAIRLAKTGHHFLDAPIIGGKVGADTGTLTIVASGDDAAIEAATVPLRQVGERFFRCGDRAGAASAVKMIDTMLIGIHTVAAAEAITFAAKVGCSPVLVHEALQHGMGNSRVFEKWVPTMMSEDFESMGKNGMASMKKDLSIVLEAAKEFSYPMPMAALALQQFCGSSALSSTKQDSASVVQLYERLGAVNLAQAARGRGNVRQYRVQLPARLREGFELDSDVVGMLDPGEIIRVVETRCHENGVDRVRCSRGWTSTRGRDDRLLLEPIERGNVSGAGNLGRGSGSSPGLFSASALGGFERANSGTTASNTSLSSMIRRGSNELFVSEL